MYRSLDKLTKITVFILALGVASIGFTSTATAQTPVEVPVQGLLTDAEGNALDETVSATFRIYQDDASSPPVWESTVDVAVDQGLFEVYLGANEELDAQIFHANPAAQMSIQIEGDEESPRMSLGAVPSAAHAVTATTADDAQTLQGQTPDELTQPEPASETTFDDSSAQLGASDTQAAIEALTQRLEALEQDNQDLKSRVSTLESVDVQALEGRVSSNETTVSDLDSRLSTAENTISNHASQISSLQGTVGSNSSSISTNASNISTNSSNISSLQSTVSTNTSDISTNASGISSNSSAISSLQTDVGDNSSSIGSLQNKTASMSTTTINGQSAVTFEGVNVHIRNGTGSTDGTVNGTGNLIVGYDESNSSTTKDGSHNIVLGERNSYTSYGGFVGGEGNSIEAGGASVFTGTNNIASGLNGAVIAGNQNESTDSTAVVVAGYSNQATGFRSVVVSGWSNIASGNYSAVLSGDSTEAAATECSIGSGNGITNNSSNTFLATGTVN
jgi:uncharacterized coiled-coil protein SlyX